MNSIRNFRDLGHIKGAFGTLKPNKLLRGGPLYNVSEIDALSLCDDIDLKTVVDFRNQHEKLNEPNIIYDGVQYHNLLIMEDYESSSDPKRMLKEAESTQSSDFMYDIYENFILGELASQSYREFLELIASQDSGSVYFHCTAGKDRTGFAAALLLKILGVCEEDIYRDFLETNENIEKHKESLLASIMKFHPFDTNDESLVLDVLGVKEDYLKKSMDTIDKVYGNFDNYLKDGLKISPGTIKSLRKNLLY